MTSNSLKIYQQPHRLFTIDSINLCLQLFAILWNNYCREVILRLSKLILTQFT